MIKSLDYIKILKKTNHSEAEKLFIESYKKLFVISEILTSENKGEYSPKEAINKIRDVFSD